MLFTDLLHSIASMWWMWLLILIIFGYLGYSVEKSGDVRRMKGGGMYTETRRVANLRLGTPGQTALVLFVMSLVLLLFGY